MRPSKSRSPSYFSKLPAVEKLTFGHTSILALIVSWCFGGAIWWSFWPICLWGSGSFYIAYRILADRQREGEGSVLKPLLVLLPCLLLGGTILLSLTNPNYHRVKFFEGEIWRKMTPVSWLPSSARPELAWRELWLWTVLYLSGFNLFFGVRQRRTLRLLASIIVANALAIAVFGTLQKLSSTDLMFWLVDPQKGLFFGSFVYRNHYAAYIVMAVAMAVGLLFHSARRHQGRNLINSPVFSGAVAIFFLAATVPLSTSRSGMLMLLFLGVFALLQAFILVNARSHADERAQGRMLLIGLTIVGLLAGGYIGNRELQTRLTDTRTQVSDMLKSGTWGNRQQVYGDTWRMIKDRPYTGWGLGSYATVFQSYNKKRFDYTGLPIYYQDAHSDWLQIPAELGFWGLSLLLAMILVAIGGRWRLVFRDWFARNICLGLLAVALYAAIEFPFANPAVVSLFWMGLFLGLRHAHLGTSSDA